MYDVLVVGAGWAGMIAAEHAARLGLRVLVVSKKVGGSLLETPLVEGVPGVGPIAGPQLAERLREQAEVLGVEFTNTDAQEVKAGLTLYAVHDAAGAVHKGKAIIYAAGRHRRMLEVLGEDEFMGKGVTSSPVTDKDHFDHKTVAVLGYSERAAQLVLWAAHGANKVYFICPGFPSALPLTIERMHQTIRIESKLNAKVKYLSGSANLEKVHLDSGDIPVDWLILAQEGAPNVEPLRGLGLKADPFLEVDARMRTGRKGIFAVGAVVGFENSFAESAAQATVAARSAYSHVRGK